MIIEKYTCYDFVSQYPKVKQWQNTLLKSGLPEKSVAEDFEQAFTNFYLSHNTFLGKAYDCSKKANNSFTNSVCC